MSVDDASWVVPLVVNSTVVLQEKAGHVLNLYIGRYVHTIDIFVTPGQFSMVHANFPGGAAQPLEEICSVMLPFQPIRKQAILQY